MVGEASSARPGRSDQGGQVGVDDGVKAAGRLPEHVVLLPQSVAEGGDALLGGLDHGSLELPPLGQGGVSIFSGARALSLAKEGLSLEPCAFFPEPCAWTDLETWLVDHVT